MNPWGLFFVAGGLFSITASVMDWDWFMNHHKARLLTTIFGRNCARGFYILLGAALVVLGALLAMGVIQDHSR